jgi:hypothetical protein
VAGYAERRIVESREEREARAESSMETVHREAPRVCVLVLFVLPIPL